MEELQYEDDGISPSIAFAGSAWNSHPRTNILKSLLRPVHFRHFLLDVLYHAVGQVT